MTIFHLGDRYHWSIPTREETGVAINYFTKWVEAEPLTIITESKIQNFVWKNIVYRFGIPRMIISENGWQFDSRSFKEFCAEMGIKNHYLSLDHPQVNR